MKKLVKMLCLLLALTLVFALVACEKAIETKSEETAAPKKTEEKNEDKQEETKEVIELDYMWMFDWGNLYDWDDPVAEHITEVTGIKWNYTVIAGDGNEKSLAMLAASNYPDLMYMGRDGVYDQYVLGGALYAVNELADQYGLDKMLTEYIPSEVAGLVASPDGNVYCIPDGYCLPSGEGAEGVGAGFNIRKDLYEQVQPGELKTMEDMYQMCVDIKASGLEYNGLKVYPFDINPAMDWLERFGNIWGANIAYNKYYDEEENQVFSSVKSPEFRQGLKYINRMLREELMDDEMLTITDWKQRQEKWAQGGYFMVFSNMWDLWSSSGVLLEMDPNASFYHTVPVPEGNPGVKPYVSGFGITGNKATVITKNNEYPEETIKMFNYLVSPEGQILQFYGVEGVTMDFKDDGSPWLKEEFVQAMKDDWGGTRMESGIRKWSFARNGAYNWEKDQEPAERKAVRDVARNFIFNATILDFPIDPASEEGIIYASLYGSSNSVVTPKIYQILLADSEDAFDQAYDALLQEFEDGGIEKVEKVWTEKYLELKAKMG